MSNDKINWAVLSPETRIYKGKYIYRWDDSAGLEHHCGVCAMPLRNARAKTTCLGKHVEPCYRFHQQLHFIGKSHECFSCNASDELHHSRHKEILTHVRKIKAIDQGNQDDPFGVPTTLGAGERRVSGATTATDGSSETMPANDAKMSRRERKKARKLGNSAAAKDKVSKEIFCNEEIDFISEAIHLVKHESKGAWAGTYNYGDQQPTNVITDPIAEGTKEDDEDFEDPMERFDDLSVKSAAVLTPEQRKRLQKHPSHYLPTKYRHHSRKYSPGLIDGLFNGVDPQIFGRLGVEVANPAQNSRARKELVAKLVALVKEDLEIIENEESEIELRRDGFWRWAGKPAFESMSKTREEIDWATGQKIGPVRQEIDAPEDGGEDAVDEADEADIEALDELEQEFAHLAIANDVDPAEDNVNIDPVATANFEADGVLDDALEPENNLPALDEPVGAKDKSTELIPTISFTIFPNGRSPRVKQFKMNDTTKLNPEEAKRKAPEFKLPEAKKPDPAIEKVKTKATAEDEDDGSWFVVKKGGKGAKAKQAAKAAGLAEAKSQFRLPGGSDDVFLA